MRSISLKLPSEMFRKLEQLAQQQRQSKSEIVRGALADLLNGEQAGARPSSALDRAGDLVGCAAGPGDLSTNPKYMEGFGQ
jgi:predicted transcriptional regulator